MVKFLIIRFSSIGDIVLTTPVIRCLKQQVEEAEVHFLTKERFATLLEANPYIDKVHSLGDDYTKTIEELEAVQVDYIIDLHKNLRSQRVRRMLKRESFSFDKLNPKKWLLVNFKKDILPDIHIVDRYIEAVSLFSVENDQQGLDYFIPDHVALEAATHSFLKSPFLILVVGGHHFTKQLPTDQVISLCDSINYPIVLIGGQEDIEKSKEVEEGLSKTVVNLTGMLSVHESAWLIKRSSLIITPDTGMMHIAAAFKKDIFSIWGNTVPKFGMYPYLPGSGSEIFEVVELNCRPCSKIGFNKCPKKHFNCMLKLDIKAIADKANFLMEQRKETLAAEKRRK